MLTGREVGAEKPSTHYPIKTPILSPCDLPNLSLGQLPQVQQLPRVQRTPIPRLTHVSRLYADHSVGGARQAPDADPLDSVCGWLRGARRAAAGPQRSQCPHQRPGRSAPLSPGVIQTLPLLVWAPSLLPGPEPGIPQLLVCLEHPPSCSRLLRLRPLSQVFSSFQLVLSWALSGAMSVSFKLSHKCPGLSQVPISLIWSSNEHFPVYGGPSCPKHACSGLIPASPTLGNPHPTQSEPGTPHLVPSCPICVHSFPGLSQAPPRPLS